MITVAKDGSGDFTSVMDAVNSITMLPETIYIKNGVYDERVEISQPYLTIIGESVNDTIITSGYYANMIMPDGIKRGTFRSYTMLVTADSFTLKNITVENSSGFGDDVGQAIALYVEGNHAVINNCRLLGHQDTLFTGPLPMSEKIPGGFTGPTQNSPRNILTMEFTDCYIEGEIDFIFGSAAVYFENCELHSLNRNKDINGYVTAPSTYENMKYGYIFNHCSFTSNCPDNSVYLGRPWRTHAKTVILNSNIGPHICDTAFHDWNKPEAHTQAFFALYNCTGKCFTKETLAPFVHLLSDNEAEEYTKEKFLNNR